LPKSFESLTGYKNFNTKGLLFNMVKDPAQHVNLYEENPEKIKEMEGLIRKYRESSFSVRR
jgi:hypothetical protein